MANKCILVGNLGRAAEDSDAGVTLRFTADGTAVANGSICTNEFFRNRDGSKGSRAPWVPLVFWGTNAENVAKYTRKGSRIYVEGRLRENSWKDKMGQTRKTLELHVDIQEFLGSPAGKEKEIDEVPESSENHPLAAEQHQEVSEIENDPMDE